MEYFFNVILSNGFTQDKTHTNKFRSDRKYYVLWIDLTEINDKIINISSHMTFNSNDIQGLGLNIKKTRFLQLIDRFINQKIPSDLLFHCEIYCYKCEDQIEQYITKHLFENIEGVVDIHPVEFGKCILTADQQSASIVIDKLKQHKFCHECNVFLMYNGSDIDT